MTEVSDAEMMDELGGLAQEIVDMIVDKYRDAALNPLKVTTATFFVAKRMLGALNVPTLTLALAHDLQAFGLDQMTGDQSEAEEEAANG